MKKIGIVTINYNNLEGLKKTIKSIENQLYKEIEYVVIDGNSTDGSIDYILECSKIISKYLIENDDGIYDALNKGIFLCEAEYIIALNSGDTFYSDNTLQQVCEEILKDDNKSDIYFGKANYVFENSKNIEWTWPATQGGINFEWLKNFNPNHQASFISKKIYNKMQYNKFYKSCGDTDLWYKIKHENCKFKYMDLIISNFYLGGISNCFNRLKDVILISNESAIINYFYMKKNLFFEFIKNFIKNFIKLILKFLLGEAKYYEKLRNKQYIMQRKYDLKEKKICQKK